MPLHMGRKSYKSRDVEQTITGKVEPLSPIKEINLGYFRWFFIVYWDNICGVLYDLPSMRNSYQ